MRTGSRPGRFGVRGVEGKVDAVRFAREHGIPFLGICLGLQCAVIEFARHVCGLADANSSEFAPGTPDPVIDLLPEQKDVTDLGATMRLGAQAAATSSRERSPPAATRRRSSRSVIGIGGRSIPRTSTSCGEHGMMISGSSQKGRLAEIVELPDHPFFIADSSIPSSVAADASPPAVPSSWAPRRRGPGTGSRAGASPSAEPMEPTGSWPVFRGRWIRVDEEDWPSPSTWEVGMLDAFCVLPISPTET